MDENVFLLFDSGVLLLGHIFKLQLADLCGLECDPISLHLIYFKSVRVLEDGLL